MCGRRSKHVSYDGVSRRHASRSEQASNLSIGRTADKNVVPAQELLGLLYNQPRRRCGVAATTEFTHHALACRADHKLNTPVRFVRRPIQQRSGDGTAVYRTNVQQGERALRVYIQAYVLPKVAGWFSWMTYMWFICAPEPWGMDAPGLFPRKTRSRWMDGPLPLSLSQKKTMTTVMLSVLLEKDEPKIETRNKTRSIKKDNKTRGKQHEQKGQRRKNETENITRCKLSTRTGKGHMYKREVKIREAASRSKALKNLASKPTTATTNSVPKRVAMKKNGQRTVSVHA